MVRGRYLPDFVYLGKVNRYKWTFLNIFRAGATYGMKDCVFYSKMLWMTLQFSRFIFWPFIEIVFPCSLWSLSKLTCFKQFIPSSYLKHLCMIYTIKVKPTIIKSVKELILYSIVYSIKYKISDPKSMQFRKILKKRFLFH